MVAFNQVPMKNLVPGAYAEFDASGALEGAPPKPNRAVIIGVVPAASTGPKETPTPVTREGQALDIWGDSQLASMADAFLRVLKRVPLELIAVDEPGAGVAAVGDVTITGTATEDGIVPVYVNGVLVQVAVASGDAAADVHAAMITAINEVADGAQRWLLPVTASDGTGKIDVTADFTGEVGNAMTLSVASQPGEELPDGLTVAVNDFASGSGVIDLSNAIAAFGAAQYDTIVTGLTDDAALTALENELADRWGPMDQRDGMIFGGKDGTHSDLTTFAGNRNSPYLSVVGSGSSPTPPWVWGAQTAAVDAGIATSPRPRFGRRLPDCKAPLESSRFDQNERGILIEEGISTFRVGASGGVLIERLVTTYTQNDATGVPDPAFRNVSTMRNLAYLRWTWNALLLLRYSDYNVADDGTQFAPGAKVVTPSVIRGEALAWFRLRESEGRVEGYDAFREALIVERDSNDVERINVLQRPNLINELVTMATRFAFVL